MHRSAARFRMRRFVRERKRNGQEEIFIMRIPKRYGNYELHPVTEIEGWDGAAWAGLTETAAQLRRRIAEKKQEQARVVVCFDLYPGVRKEEIAALARELGADEVIDVERCAKPQEQRLRELDDYITDDRVFGVLCHKKLSSLYDAAQAEALRARIADIKSGVIVLLGLGAALFAAPDVYVYCDITRWEIQLRYRAGAGNWNCDNGDDPVLRKYKLGYFIEWRLADRYKKERYERFDYVLETESEESASTVSSALPEQADAARLPAQAGGAAVLSERADGAAEQARAGVVQGRYNLIRGDAFRAALAQVCCRPFRMEPYFDPGVWGGHWMQENFGAGQEKENLAWSFDGVPEENCLNLRIGGVTFKTPAMNAVLYRPRPLLGERVHGRYGSEFPIRFDLLDTMGGGNLSLQVHPLTEYIQDTFGMHYTQDESYYLLDADEDEETYVYLGVQKDADPAAMEAALREAQAGGAPFPAERFVNKIPVKRHDHVLIPAGTVHCSGKNTMVLEISATPYIFTFKLWDWGRVGLDGLPRPIHIDHGMKNIQWDRDREWAEKNLVHQEREIESGDGYAVERTGLHEREPIETKRYTMRAPHEIDGGGSVMVCNLVDGEEAVIESADGAFPPLTVHYAETCIIPAAAGRCRIVPKGEVKLLTATVRA